MMMATAVSSLPSVARPPRRLRAAPGQRPAGGLAFSRSRPARQVQVSASAISAFQALPPLAQAAAVALPTLGAGILLYLSNSGAASAAAAGGEGASAAPAPEPEDAVLVVGATGRTGREAVRALRAQGRWVVAACRDASKARGVLVEEMGLPEGADADASRGGLKIAGGVDVSDETTLSEELFLGVSQVVTTLGPIFGRTPEGGMGYLGGMSSDVVDAAGVAAVARAARQYLPAAAATAEPAIPMRPEDWERLDDVIMGGASSSGISEATPEADGFTGVVWSGELVVEGGGFCGTRTVPLEVDLGAYDGLQMRVRGDGQRYKVNIKTDEFGAEPESTYQAVFDTVEGQWMDVRLPWANFVAVRRALVTRDAPPLDPAAIVKLGLVLSRFEFNRFPNPSYKPGPFRLEIDGPLMGYRAARPQLVMMSTAGVERNARIQSDEERLLDIPIVQLNPGGALNWKYKGETAVRASGLPYTVVRATGLTTEGEGEDVLIEAGQGDLITGTLSRADVARVLAAAVGSAEAAGKTFEVRRSQARDAQGVASDGEHLRGMLLRLCPDKDRTMNAVPPFPAETEWEGPVSEERKQEILAIPAVRDAAARNAARWAQQGGGGGPPPKATEEAKAKAEEPVKVQA
mmetsp:Transcript_26186/g.83691  ORF Transcript_26186/g.83691 Transcript_26186/m.83691 type:complete len:633 (+) Transcript_26186:205-2103(+)